MWCNLDKRRKQLNSPQQGRRHRHDHKPTHTCTHALIHTPGRSFPLASKYRRRTGARLSSAEEQQQHMGSTSIIVQDQSTCASTKNITHTYTRNVTQHNALWAALETLLISCSTLRKFSCVLIHLLFSISCSSELEAMQARAGEREHAPAQHARVNRHHPSAPAVSTQAARRLRQNVRRLSSASASSLACCDL